MLHIGKINLKAFLFNLSPGSTSFKQLIFNILRTGTSFIKEERELQRVIMVNALSFSLVFITATVGMIFFFVSGKLMILIPALLESSLACYGLYFNRLKKHRLAALFTYYLQCCAALYFGLILGKVISLHLMIVFLILIALRLFPGKEQKVTRTLCLFTAIVVMVMIELGNRFHLVQTVNLNSAAFDIFYYIALAGVMLLIYIIGKPYVQSNDALIISNYFKGQYVAEICHELRNRLNNISLPAMVLNREIKKDDDQKQIRPLVDTIALNVNYAKSIVNNVLSLAKIESGESDPIVEETFNADSFFTKIIDANRISAASRGIKIRYISDPDSFLIVKADSFKLNEIFTNLLGNAIKYGDKNSIIRVHRAQIGNQLSISVINKGKPIPPDKQQSIFAPYVTNKYDHATEGTGMGLFIVQNTVNALGGKITLECASGEVNFTLFLPIAEGNLADVKPEEDDDFDFDCTSLKVLIVDDNTLSSMVLKRLIKGLGGTANCVSDGNEAIDEVRKQTYDLIITDLHMPNLDGYGLLQFVKENELYNRIPVVLSTGGGVKERPPSDYSFDGVLYKPITPTPLKDMLEKFSPANKLLVHLK